MIWSLFRVRGKAALVHLGGSGLIAAVAAILVFAIWYPGPYTVLAGGTGLFVLITSVDVALGPLLTFAVFNPAKGRRKIAFDLCVIVLVQLAALAYGLHTMYIARPVALALETDRFRVVTAADVLEEELAVALPELKNLPIDGPRMLRTVVPVDPAEQMEAIERAIAGADLGARPKYWRPWDQVARGEVMIAAKPVGDLRRRFPQRVSDLAKAVKTTGLPAERVGYLPVISKHAEWVALVDKDLGDVVGYAPVSGF